MFSCSQQYADAHLPCSRIQCSRMDAVVRSRPWDLAGPSGGARCSRQVGLAPPRRSDRSHIHAAPQRLR